jgi:hypothetical protein
MQMLRRVLPTLLAVGAVGVILVTLLSDHKSEYGRVALPPGGVVALEGGTTKVFVEEQVENLRSSDPRRLAAPLRFQVVPVNGGQPLALDPTTSDGTAEGLTTRSQAIGSAGAVADLKVPEAGTYRVVGSEGSVGVTLSFGETPFSAVLGGWKIWGGLLVAALLITMLPAPTKRSSGDSADSVDSTASGEGAFQPPRYTPYSG